MAWLENLKFRSSENAKNRPIKAVYIAISKL
nr:MAG TPA: hypothetical protein [Caudoviricetes sp.]DAW42370.1 MAG TPA: hypothetical protein [Caudoviricetes sp.]